MRNTIIERPYYLEKLKSYTGTDIIRVITGVRRCGKSSCTKTGWRSNMEKIASYI